MSKKPDWPGVYPPSTWDLLFHRLGRRLAFLLGFAGILPVTLFFLLGQRGLLPILAVSVGIALVLGLGEARRYLTAQVGVLQTAQRVGAGQYDLPTEVGHPDEFGGLNSALNGMTRSVARRFEDIEHDREMDRAILSTLDTAGIAQMVLEYLPSIIPCRAASLTVAGTRTEHGAVTWIASGADLAERRMVTTQFSSADIVAAQEHPEWSTFATKSELPGFLSAHRDTGRGSLLALPLHEAGELIGVLAVEPLTQVPSPSSLPRLRNLGDRIAKALGNSRMMDQVRALAFYDALTRLPNRVLYRERLGQAIGRARAAGRRVAVCSLDLDHFGRINDTLGPARGDQLIREVGARLNQLCRPGDDGQMREASWDEAHGLQIARLGGDEFAIILPDLDHDDSALALARRALGALQEPIQLGGQEIFVTASIGIAIHPVDGHDTETLHKNADVALSSAKKEGRNTIERYAPVMNAQAVGRMRLEQELRRAVEHGEFTMWYQPVVDLRTRFAVGAEALVRWDHPDRGLVSPAEFMQLCEESGLIVPLGEWSLRSVCNQAKRWETDGFSGLRLSVNFSARQLRHAGITRMVQDILHETGARSDQLTIELTESLLMEKGGVVERRLRELAEMGIQLAIDDFGTGYSSLSYLRNFPVSTLKIDRSFIVDVPANPDAATITVAVIALAKAMNLEVVAEGVETREQADFLRGKGCEKAQGYLLGRPAPVQMFSEYLKARQRRQAIA